MRKEQPEQADVAGTEQAPENASAEQTEVPAPEQVATAPSAEASQEAPCRKCSRTDGSSRNNRETIIRLRPLKMR
jgi:hypothetical protein